MLATDTRNSEENGRKGGQTMIDKIIMLLLVATLFVVALKLFLS